MPLIKGSVPAWNFEAACREQVAKNEAVMKEFMEAFSNPGIEIVKAEASAPSVLSNSLDLNLRMPVAVMQGDKSAKYPALDEPVLVVQSSLDIQAKLSYGNLSRADLAVKLAKAQEIVAAMSTDDPERTKAMRILAINLHVKFLRTRKKKKKYLDLAIHNGRTSMTAESSDLLHFADMHRSRYDITKNLDDLEEAISNVTIAISKVPEAASDFAYANLRGYRLQKYNHTRRVEDLKAVFCTSAATAANSLKWGTHRGISDDGDWHRKIHNITFLIPIFLRHGIELPALQPSTRGIKEWKAGMIKMFDRDTTGCLLEVFDNLRFKNKAAGSSKPTADDQPRYLRTGEAILADIYVSESGDHDSLVNRDAPSTGGTSPANLENPPPSAPHESTLDEPADGGNSNSGSVEDLVPQTEVNDVKEGEIISDSFTRLLHMMSEKRKLNEYMNIQSHPINRAASSSLLSCAFSQPYINADYELPIDDVCFRVAIKILDMSRNLDLFSAVQHDPEMKLEDIPVSWVPRWDHPRISSYLGAMSPDRKCPGNFDGTNTCITQKSEPPKKEILTIPGFLVDKIASSTDLINQDTFDNPGQFSHLWMKITNLKPSFQAGSLQRVEVYQRTLTAGNSFSELYSLAEPILREEEVKNSFAAFWVRVWDALHAAGLGDWPIDSNIFPVEELREAAKKGNHNAFFQMAAEICCNRRVFSTSKGYLGVGPGILQQDDVVCVLPYKLPFVLRPTVAEHDVHLSHAHTDAHPLDTTSICRRFRLVGECYVDDIMEGKAMDGLEKQLFEIQ